MIKRLSIKLKEQKGFTLIELLAVIVILGIIAAIAIPAIGNVISKSKDDAKIAEAISIIDAARIANVELDPTGTLPTGVTTTNDASGNLATISWTEAALKEYLSKVKDADFDVTYNVTTKTFSIDNHDAESVDGVDVATGTPATSDGILTEEELANASR
ncbi:prepilin-type N-terminal cleavage/methylation domain-containing protein [Neobacillus niacini]|uniref:prepilin-type N-terminal cleavage/methylation domain-containing protein n=1 Tax=Neobacillus niacini TaxID=86668 RepID=UPI003B01616B